MTWRRPNIGARLESGTITLWMLGLCLMLFLLGGISLDLWRAFSERRSLASTADAAAVAGASALDEAAYRNSGAVRLVPADAQRRARASLADQLDRRALRDARVEATEDAVMITVGGSVNFSLCRSCPRATSSPSRCTQRPAHRLPRDPNRKLTPVSGNG